MLRFASQHAFIRFRRRNKQHLALKKFDEHSLAFLKQFNRATRMIRRDAAGFSFALYQGSKARPFQKFRQRAQFNVV